MPIFTDGLRLEPENTGVTEYSASLGASLKAAASDALSDSPTAQLLGVNELNAAKAGQRGVPETDAMGNITGFLQEPDPDLAPVPTIDKAAALDRIKQAGLEKDLHLPDQEAIATPALDIMIDRARERREREATMQRGPQGFLPSALSVGTSFLVGAVDPINLASAFIPVMGELRYGKLLASAGESAIGRFGVRAGVGAAQGAVGQAALEPLNWYAHTQEGRDFGMADVLRDLAFGAALGGGLHAVGGGVSDIYRKRQGRAVYPFGPGEPMEHVTGTHLPESALADEGVAHGDLPEHLQPELAPDIVPDVAPEPGRLAPAPIQILQDLPPRAQEDSMRAALANIIEGEPVKVGEMLRAAADTDPRIAESFEAWHGSPYTFDRFDASQIGNGEGSQSFGHGLYFAEKEAVARDYKRRLSDEEGGVNSQAWDDPDIGPRLAEARDGYDRVLEKLTREDDSAKIGDLQEKLGQAHKFWESMRRQANEKYPPGSVYRVKIKADREHFLDWDKAAAEQSPHVQEALAKIGMMDNPHATGEEIHVRHSTRLAESHGPEGGPRMMRVSHSLQEAGIPGIKYLDQGSRDAGEGTRNFVVFDDQHVEIVDRNGVPVARPFTESSAGNPKITLGAPAEASPKPRGRAGAHPDTLSLNEHLASQGGLAPHPELEAVYGSKRGPFVPGFGPLIRNGGKSLDDALSSAKQHGYMFDPHDVANGTAGSSGRTDLGLTPRDLLDHLDNENRGQKLYKPGHVEATRYDAEQEKHIIMGHLEQELEASGAKVSDIDPKLLDRTVEIVHRDGESDVMVAYERAIMEDTERYDALADARQSDPAAAGLPGWDVPDDVRTASADGRYNPADSGPAGRADQGTRRGDGAQSSRDGAGDRQAPGAAWHELAARRYDVDDAELLAASRAAESLPDPIGSNLDKRLAAAERADADAKATLDLIQDSFTPEEREALNDVLTRLDQDAAARAEAIKRAGSCIFRAPRQGASIGA